MASQQVMLITGTRKGIGRHMAGYFLEQGYRVVGCSRKPPEWEREGYHHHCLDISDEKKAKELFLFIKRSFGRLDILINNAGIAAMNHALLTPMETVERILRTNIAGTFLFCREAAKIMQRKNYGRIVNFATVATPLKLEGEAIYAASKAAVISLTEILSRELAAYNITVNAVGPTPIRTDLIRAVPDNKLQALLQRQAIHRFGEFEDVLNVVEFFIRPGSSFITGQTIFLGGV